MVCHRWRSAFAAVCAAGTLAVAGCQSLGPTTVQRDRAEYSDAISQSWKRQALLNIVKLRYLDPPIFVDVGQIVAGYSLETNLTLGASFPETSALGGDTSSIGGAARYTDRPTVTYVPLTGNNFMRGLLAPLPPASLFALMQSGHPADIILLVAASSLNGLKNQEATLDGVAPADPRFMRVLELLRTVQTAGALSMRVEVDPDKRETTILALGRDVVLPREVEDARRELRTLLALDPEANEFRLVFGTLSTNPREIAVSTRSLIQLMQLMSSQVDVPSADVVDGRVPRGWSDTPGMPAATRLIAISSGAEAPADAAVAVRYRGHEYWIDDHDLRSKRSFNLIMLMFTLANTDARDAAPVITIPAQ
jgi:hypothetical protein